MFRYHCFDSADFYCRYLDAQLYLPPMGKAICNDRFLYFLKNKLGIQRLPYSLSLVDLLTKAAIIPDLFVKLPAEYFEVWRNFPERPAQYTMNREGRVEAAECHSLYIVPTGTFSMEDLLHPYDRDVVKTKFIDSFASEAPRMLTYGKHANGHHFIPYEAYFNYWKGYVFVEALDGFEDIENFLTQQVGRAAVVARFTDLSAKWEEHYKATFSRVSFYRTAVTILTHWKEKPSVTYGDLAKFLQTVVKTDSSELEHDLEILLTLFAEWKKRSEVGRRYYAQAVELLRQDIYFVLEWLCGLTRNSETFYFKKWRYKDRTCEVWAELKEVIPYEEFELQQMFETLVQHYAETLVKSGHLKDPESVYKRLVKHESFWPWLRAFTDLHRSLDSSKPISFQQPRILDHLLVVAIRTEILIRSLISEIFAGADPRKFREVFNRLSQKFPEKSSERSILGTVADKANWELTELSGKPQDIFGSIDVLTRKEKWSKTKHEVFTSILRFVTARNYFAHHSFKDESLNNQVSDLAGRVLISCVESVVYIDSARQALEVKHVRNS